MIELLERFRFPCWREFWTRDITSSCVIWRHAFNLKFRGTKQTWQQSFWGWPLTSSHDVTFRRSRSGKRLSKPPYCNVMIARSYISGIMRCGHKYLKKINLFYDTKPSFAQFFFFFPSLLFYLWVNSESTTIFRWAMAVQVISWSMFSPNGLCLARWCCNSGVPITLAM